MLTLKEEENTYRHISVNTWPTPWATRSPDLIPLDFGLWGQPEREKKVYARDICEGHFEQVLCVFDSKAFSTLFHKLMTSLPCDGVRFTARPRFAIVRYLSAIEIRIYFFQCFNPCRFRRTSLQSADYWSGEALQLYPCWFVVNRNFLVYRTLACELNKENRKSLNIF